MKNSNETNNLFLLALIIIKRISLSPNMNFCKIVLQDHLKIQL
tara:strand:+ start:100 stop:228 length:129 start_codon:yes stop_codon:yes gene_type:complete